MNATAELQGQPGATNATLRIDPGREEKGTSLLFEITNVLVRLNHVARFIVNANYGSGVSGETYVKIK